MNTQKITKEFRERFPNLNDSTENGGYDAKQYVLNFLLTSCKDSYEEGKRDMVEEIKKSIPKKWEGTSRDLEYFGWEGYRVRVSMLLENLLANIIKSTN